MKTLTIDRERGTVAVREDCGKNALGEDTARSWEFVSVPAAARQLEDLAAGVAAADVEAVREIAREAEMKRQRGER